MRARPSSSANSLQLMPPTLFKPALARPGSSIGGNFTSKASTGRTSQEENSSRAVQEKLNFKPDTFVGSLTSDTNKRLELAKNRLFDKLSLKSPSRSRFHDQFGSPMSRIDAFESYLSGKMESQQGTVRGFKTSGFMTATGKSEPMTTSLLKLLSAKKPQLQIRANTDDIAINGRSAAIMMPSSIKNTKRRTPRDKKVIKVTTHTEPIVSDLLITQEQEYKDMQDQLRQKLQGYNLASNKDIDNDSWPDSITDFDSTHQSKLHMSPKYRDNLVLKSSPETKSSLKPPLSRPESSVAKKQVSVKFTVEIGESARLRPHSSGKLIRGRSLKSPLSASHLGLRNLKLS